MDRPTGNYTHERLIALEDSHKAMMTLLTAYVCFSEGLPEGRVVEQEIARAASIRREAGLQ